MLAGGRAVADAQPQNARRLSLSQGEVGEVAVLGHDAEPVVACMLEHHAIVGAAEAESVDVCRARKEIVEQVHEPRGEMLVGEPGSIVRRSR